MYAALRQSQPSGKTKYSVGGEGWPTLVYLGREAQYHLASATCQYLRDTWIPAWPQARMSVLLLLQPSSRRYRRCFVLPLMSEVVRLRYSPMEPTWPMPFLVPARRGNRPKFRGYPIQIRRWHRYLPRLYGARWQSRQGRQVPSGITMCVHAIYHGFYVGTRSEIQSYHADLLLSSQCRRCRDSVFHVGATRSRDSDSEHWGGRAR